jgi:Ran GTPase-activating protein (RanGAP) involved in mRNA processing and transport
MVAEYSTARKQTEIFCFLLALFFGHPPQIPSFFSFLGAPLAKLDIGSNRIEDAGAQRFAQVLTHNSTLSSLNISDNEITYVGARAIAASLCANVTLTHLDMSENDVETKPMLDMLRVNTALLHLYHDDGNSLELNNLLERNFNMCHAAKQAVLCLLARRKFRKTEMQEIGKLDPSIFLVIAKMVWSTRQEKAWLGLVLRAP